MGVRHENGRSWTEERARFFQSVSKEAVAASLVECVVSARLEPASRILGNLNMPRAIRIQPPQPDQACHNQIQRSVTLLYSTDNMKHASYVIGINFGAGPRNSGALHGSRLHMYAGRDPRSSIT